VPACHFPGEKCSSNGDGQAGLPAYTTHGMWPANCVTGMACHSVVTRCCCPCRHSFLVSVCNRCSWQACKIQ
jgi:hypothetical protein